MGLKGFCAAEKPTQCFVFSLITVSGLGSPQRVVKMYLRMQMQHFLGDAPGNGLSSHVILKNKREANLLI